MSEVSSEPIGPLEAPFPWYGGKRRVASHVWMAFGDVSRYIEPFFGGGAVLLGRPGYNPAKHDEIVNDKYPYLANFWRAASSDPESVAHYAEYPVSEVDLYARHRWLLTRSEFRNQVMMDPHYYDVKIAGWWLWGINIWIGDQWVEEKKYTHESAMSDSSFRPISKRWVSDGGAFRGKTLSLHGESSPMKKNLIAIMRRMRQARIMCGDWKRCVASKSMLGTTGYTGIFFDPPYTKSSGRKKGLYSHDSMSVGHDVAEWAVANGNNPSLRIALCGFVGEYDEMMRSRGWSAMHWTSTGSAANNKDKEVIWFSPHCQRQMSIFDILPGAEGDSDLVVTDDNSAISQLAPWDDGFSSAGLQED